MAFSISGNVYTSGALLTLSGAVSATTNAASDGSYSFTGLAAGSYVVTPTSAGFTFTPTSTPVVIGTINVTNINFYPSPTSPTAPYSVPDCRDTFIFPNAAIDIQLTETYIVQTSSNSAVPSADSRLAGQLQDCRMLVNIPLNCRVGSSTPSTGDLLLQEDGVSFFTLENGSGFIALEV